ncbi:glyoxylate/hydroxypyruvate reductase A [Acetobacter oeni]|nr:glyoxylate/hydroxypyruvate reductase A [Acetobacter oeni]
MEAGGEKTFSLWRDLFRKIAPSLNIVWWKAPDVDPAAVDYLLVWKPPAGGLTPFSGLKGIICTGAGVDHLLKDPDWPVKVPLIRMGGERTGVLMAEFVLWACLSLFRGARAWAWQQERHIFERELITRVASEVSVGIMGFGSLGRVVAQRLLLNGFRVRGWSRSGRAEPGVEVFAGEEALGAFLGGTDILVNLLPNTPETADRLDRDVFAGLPGAAAVVNVGRGTQLVEADLLAALDSGHLSGAVLDVFRTEPPDPDSPLWVHPRITMTPHAASEASRADHARYVADVIGQLEKGGMPDLAYDFSRGY